MELSQKLRRKQSEGKALLYCLIARFYRVYYKKVQWMCK